MRMRSIGLASLLGFGLAVSTAGSTELTFDIEGISNFQAVPQEYGDFVTAEQMGDFSYGPAEGFTPNVEVSYTTGPADPSLWTTGYGDLVNILFEDTDNYGILEIVFSADPGYNVRIHSFDLAAYDGAFFEDPMIDALRVLDGSCQPLFEQFDVVVSETSRTTFDFSDEPLGGQTVRIIFEAGNLGSLSDDIAIDNIVFSQIPFESCGGDFNGDGVKNVLDFVAFQTAFVAADPSADCTEDCGFDILDFVCFQSSFMAPCD